MFTSNVVSMLNDRNKITQVSYLTKTGPMNAIVQGKRSYTLGALFNGTKSGEVRCISIASVFFYAEPIRAFHQSLYYNTTKMFLNTPSGNL